MVTKTKADSYQVGGDHYKQEGNFEEHWTRVHRLGQDYFQGCITKYVERWKKKGGIQDLEKARHFLDKYIELEKAKLPEEPMEDFIKPGETMTQYWQRGRTVADLDNKIDATRIKSSDKHIEYGVGIKNPRLDSYKLGEVLSTGWSQFVFEGSQSAGYLYTCRECGAHFNAPPHVNPHNWHPCHKVASDNGPVYDGDPPMGMLDGSEPQSQGYVNQNGNT